MRQGSRSTQLLNTKVSAFPLTLGSNGRYLQDNLNRPFLMNSVAAWSLIAQCTKAETTEFLDYCVTAKVNSLRVNLVEAFFVDKPQYSGQNISGDSAWTGTPFQSTLGTAYWDHVEWVLDQAENRGILICAAPAYLGNGGGGEGWWGIAGGAPNGMKQAGTAGMQNYGVQVGARLNRHKNILMTIGGDYWPGFDGSPSSAANVAVETAMVTGLKTTDRPGRLYTAHWGRGTNSIDAAESWLDVNLSYTAESGQYYTSNYTKAAYQNSPTRPTFWGEGIYKHAQIGSPPTDKEIRLQYWQSLCWGACGQESCSEGLWPMGCSNAYVGDVDWRNYINIPWWNHLAQVQNIMGVRNWHLTAPDFSHTVVTAGYGTEDTTGFCAVRSSSSLLIAYCPNGATLTINQANFSGPIDIKKYDPTNGAVTVIASGVSNSGSAARAFTGTNAGGDSDWIAIVELS